MTWSVKSEHTNNSDKQIRDEQKGERKRKGKKRGVSLFYSSFVPFVLLGSSPFPQVYPSVCFC